MLPVESSAGTLRTGCATLFNTLSELFERLGRSGLGCTAELCITARLIMDFSALWLKLEIPRGRGKLFQ